LVAVSLSRRPIIRSLPEKSPPADNLQAKIRPARRPPWRDGFFTGKLSTGKRLFGGGGRSYNGKLFHRAGDILIRGRYIKSVIIFTRRIFHEGGILM